SAVHGSLVVRSRLYSRRGLSLARNPIPLKIPVSLVYSKYEVGQTSSMLVWCGGGVPAQASTSSSDHGSKLRDQFHYSPRVASKQYAYITNYR
ncbi:hypothetical protein AVEN_206861-1, partial [Araneus ventricosus]